MCTKQGLRVAEAAAGPGDERQVSVKLSMKQLPAG
jgi:hypothetical protein